MLCAAAVAMGVLTLSRAAAPSPPAPAKALLLDLQPSAGTDEVARAATNVLAVELPKDGRFALIVAKKTQ